MGRHSDRAQTGAPRSASFASARPFRHALAQLLVRGEIDDIIQSHVITVTEVRMSPDLKLATAYIMPLGGADLKPVLEALDRNRKFIRAEVAHAVNLKFAPVFVSAKTRPSKRQCASTGCYAPHVRRDIEKTADADDKNDE